MELLRCSLQCSAQGHPFSNDTKGDIVPPDLHMLFFPWSETISLLSHTPLFSLEELRGLEHRIKQLQAIFNAL